VLVSKPEQYPGVNGTATYSERLLVGYRWYDEQNVAPLFPFGFGLSYTTFQLSKLSLQGTDTVALDVTNIGKREGAEVVQVYVAAPADAGEPPRQLKGFAKVSLKPGETRRVSIALDDRAYSIWDDRARRWTFVPGKHEIYVGDSSRNLSLHAVATIPAKPERAK
jgi:beta-glucosidase